MRRGVLPILAGTGLLTFAIFEAIKKRSLPVSTYKLPWKYRVLQPWLKQIKLVAAKYGVDPSFLASEIYQESRGNPYAVSSIGAIGLGQIMPSTGRSVCGLEPYQLKDPFKNMDCMARFIKTLHDRYKRYDWVAAKYYGGTKATPTSTFGNPPANEYVYQVISRWAELKKIIDWSKV